MDDLETWLWDNPDCALAVLVQKEKVTRDEAKEICKEFYEATEKDRLLVVVLIH
jgi:hypothetical protein